MVSVADVAHIASPVVGLGIGIWGVLRFLRWAVEFAYKRMDIRASQLDTREESIERKFNDRLKHVENELSRYRHATMLLVNALADRDPTNRVLTEVARLLNTAIPIPASNKDLDDLVDRLE